MSISACCHSHRPLPFRAPCSVEASWPEKLRNTSLTSLLHRSKAFTPVCRLQEVGHRQVARFEHARGSVEMIVHATGL